MTLDILSFGVAFVVGAGLGFLHFCGLWQTVRHLGTARQPHLLLWASTLGRLGISLAGFYGVTVWGGGLHLLVCLAGFLSLRHVLIRRWRPVSVRLP